MYTCVEHAPLPGTDQRGVHNSLNELIGWMRGNGLAGYDPYDALASPLLASIAQRVPLVGWLAIQALRLSPFNLRALLGIRPEFDAKALGLIARACFLLWDYAGDANNRHIAGECLRLLQERKVQGFAGACWAHPFPYYSSRGYLPANFPTAVSTVYAAQAFLDGYERNGEKDWLEVARSACDYILTDLPRIGREDQFCFGYYPGVPLPVHNANLLAGVLLARVARLMGEDGLLKPMRASLHYTLNDQRPDGSWPYDGPESPSRGNTFVDGFHTGFVLESLWDISNDAGVDLGEPIARGLRFYLDYLFEPGGELLRKVGQRWPLDLRDCAQGIITLAKLRDVDPRAEAMLHQVVSWTIHNMQAKGGYFYYLRWRRFVIPIPYIRFQAWMMVALATHLHVTRTAEAAPHNPRATAPQAIQDTPVAQML